jgi:CRISPR/Cas system CMR-associated protein Cmr5 small subunit
MSDNQIDIKIKPTVDGDELETLNKQIKQLAGEETQIKVDADTKTSVDKLKEIQGKAKEISAEKTVVNIGVATEGLKEIEKIKSEYEDLKNMLPPNLRVKMDAVAEERIDEIRKKINDLDGLSPQIKAMVESEAIDELQAIQTASDNLDGQSPKIKPTVDGSEAIGELDNIQNKMEGMSGLESGITGVLGAFGAGQLLSQGVQTATNMDKAWRSWVGSLQNSGMELGAAKKKADGFYKTVNNLASVGQSNDSFFKNIAGLMISNNNNISDSTLKMTENVVAGYEMMRSKSGDTLYEMEKELQNYLITGETTRLTELESVGGGKWMPLLEAASTAEERMKVLNDLLQEEGYMAALNIDAPSKSIDQLKAMFDAAMTNIGTTIINMVKPIADGFMWLDKITNGMSTSILSTVAVVGLLGVSFIGIGGYVLSAAKSFTGFFSAIKSGTGILNAIKGGGMVAQTSQLAANTSALTTNTAALEANNLARASSMGGAAKGIKGIGAVGSAAGGSTGGMKSLVVGLKTFGNMAPQLIVPMLKIAAVVAIMIPIVAGLAIEILAFVRLIGEVVKWLAFDKLDLGSSIEGIKQIGLAMWEILKAFTVLTAINVVNVVYTATGGILGTSIALAQFWIAAKEIEVVLKEIAKMNIDISAVTKIKQIAEAIKGISTAMGQLTGLNLSGLGVMLTGGMKAVRQNIRHMTDIGKEIQAINIPSIPKEKTDMIQRLAETLSSLQKASDAVNESLGWFGEKMTTLDDTNGIKTTLDNFYMIANDINSVNIDSVSSDKTDTIKRLSEVIGDLEKASKAIKENLGWFGEKMVTITDTKGLKTTLDNLYIISTDIKAVNIQNIPKDRIDAIRNIKNAIMPLVESSKAINDNWSSIVATPDMAEPFKKAIDTIYSINQHINTKAFNLDQAKIQAISNMKTVIEAIASIGLFISNNTGNLGDYITEHVKNIKSSISGLYSINQKINECAFNLAPEKVTAISNLRPFIERMGDIGLFISNNTGNLGKTITDNKDNIISAIGALYSINQKINSMPFQIDQAKTDAITALQTLIRTINNTLSAGAGVQAAAQNMGSKITTGFKTGAKNLGAATVTIVGNAINAVKNRYDTMQSAGNALGAALARGFKAGAQINSPMAIVVYGINSTLDYLKGLHSAFYSAGSRLGENFARGLSEEEKQNLNINDALRQNSGSIMDIYYGSDVKWVGGSAGSPFEETGSIGNMNTSSGSSVVNNFNGLVIERDVANYIMDIVQKTTDLDNMRS